MSAYTYWNSNPHWLDPKRPARKPKPEPTYAPTLEQLVYRFQHIEKYGPNQWGDAPDDGARRLQAATEEIARFERKPKPTPRKRTNLRPVGNLIEDIEYLLDAGEGEHAIIKAIGYLGREESLEARLRRHSRQDLTRRIFSSRDRAA